MVHSVMFIYSCFQQFMPTNTAYSVQARGGEGVLSYNQTQIGSLQGLLATSNSLLVLANTPVLPAPSHLLRDPYDCVFDL